MTALAGFDISTREITAAIIPLDSTTRHLDDETLVHFYSETLPAGSDDDPRYRAIRVAVRGILGSSPYDVQLAYVERPWSRFAKSIAPMMGVYGAVMASIPLHIVRAGISPSEWRHELGLPQRLTKPDAIREASVWLAQAQLAAGATRYIGDGFPTEHQAESLLVAIAGRQINDRHFRVA
jgi:hypothetical protein